jgi:hypothetical protein
MLVDSKDLSAIDVNNIDVNKEDKLVADIIAFEVKVTQP